jgi:hypothetical protein
MTIIQHGCRVSSPPRELASSGFELLEAALNRIHHPNVIVVSKRLRLLRYHPAANDVELIPYSRDSVAASCRKANGRVDRKLPPARSKQLRLLRDAYLYCRRLHGCTLPSVFLRNARVLAIK